MLKGDRKLFPYIWNKLKIKERIVLYKVIKRLLNPRGSYSKNQHYKKSQKPYKVCGSIFSFFHVTEEGWERRGGKGEGGCRENFL